jgi:transposase
MRPIQIPEQSEEQIKALADLYRTTRNVRLRTRAQMVLLAVEQHLTAAAIAAIVRESEGTVRCWLKRYLAEGMAGLQDAWAGGAPAKVTEEYKEQLLQVVRRRPDHRTTVPLSTRQTHGWTKLVIAGS